MSDEQPAPPRRKRLHPNDRRQSEAAAVQLLFRFYARKAQKGREPNDRTRARGAKELGRRLRPEALDALLREGE